MPKSDMLFCGEHTDYYSGNLPVFLNESSYDMWLVSGLEMKLTQGIKRNKIDRIDACKIAEHAYRYQDKVVLFQPVSKALEEIREFVNFHYFGLRFGFFSYLSLNRLETFTSSNSELY